jgi:Family of unknown function (DUF6084)
MPDLDFQVTGIEADARGLTPLLTFTIEVTSTPGDVVIQSVPLQAQIQIQAPRRSYNAQEKEKLSDLFGPPEQWGKTLRGQFWTHAQTVIRSFSGKTTAQLPVQCTFDLNVLAAKYFYALEDGDIPLIFLFSGTIFYQNADDRLQAQQVSWNKESTFRVPVKTWRELMDRHYPNTTFLTLQRDTLDRLYAFRRARGLTGWDETIDALLAAQAAEALP